MLLRRLRQIALLFVVTIALPSRSMAEPVPKLFYTDWTVVPGRVFYQGSSGEQTLVRGAAGGNIHSVKVGPDGVTYLVDANRFDVLSWTGAVPQVLYHHTTYVRDVAFDAQGRLYFSEATGARRNGRIYRLDDAGATLYYTVVLASVGGFWGGHFAFAPDGTLYLSTGNRRGARIYRAQGGTPSLFFNDPAGVITGFDFDAAGNIFYADWSTRIYRVTPAAVRTLEITLPGRYISDVDVVDRSIALGPEAGRVNSVALHPTNANILYAGGSSGGVFRSANGGRRWWLRSRGLMNPTVDGLLVHPTGPAWIFAVGPSGVFLSTNDGLNWAHTLAIDMPLPPPAVWSTALTQHQKSPIRFQPATGVFYAAPFCAGLYQSPNGVSWTQVYPVGPAAPLESCVTSIDVSPVGGGTVYITTPLGIQQKIGGGAWTPMGAEINDANPLVLRVAPSDPDRLYVAATTLDGRRQSTNVWVRATAGGPFARTTATPPWPRGFFAFSLAVHPTNPLRLFFGSFEIYSTLTGGNWAEAGCRDSTICVADYRGVFFDAAGSRLFAAHDQGIFRLDLATNRYTALDAGLLNTQFYDLDVGSDGAVYGGTQDRGAFRRAGTAAWTHVATGSGDVLDLLAHPTNQRRIFVRISGTVIRSDDAGATIARNPSVPSGGFWNHQLAYDAATTTVYAGTMRQGVYKSTNDGVSYSAANTGIENREIRCLALQPGSNTVAYAGTFADGVFKTTNGSTWSRLTAFPETGAPVPETGALVLAVNPAATRVFAGTKSGVYVSTTGGASWTASSTGLPPVRVVSDLHIDPVCPCLIYAGLGFYDSGGLYGGGIYQSPDGGATWTPLTAANESGLSVTSIRIDAADRSRLHFSTYGSGVRTLFRSTVAAGGCSC